MIALYAPISSLRTCPLAAQLLQHRNAVEIACIASQNRLSSVTVFIVCFSFLTSHYPIHKHNFTLEGTHQGFIDFITVPVCLNGTKRQNAIRYSALQCSGNGTARGRMQDDGEGALSAITVSSRELMVRGAVGAGLSRGRAAARVQRAGLLAHELLGLQHPAPGACGVQRPRPRFPLASEGYTDLPWGDTMLRQRSGQSRQ